MHRNDKTVSPRNDFDMGNRYGLTSSEIRANQQAARAIFEQPVYTPPRRTSDDTAYSFINRRPLNWD